MGRPLAGTLVALALFAGAGSARAQSFETARLLGFGGARRALGFSTEAVFVNPAGLAFGRAYDVESSYGDDLREADRRVNLTIADGQAGDVAGALAFTYGRQRPPGSLASPERLEGLRVDVAAAIGPFDGFALGVSTRYANLRRLDGNGEEIADGGAEDVAFDAGLQWRPGGGVALGASIRNFTAGRQPGLPRAWGAGIGYQTGPFLAEVDVDHAWETRDPTYTGTLGYVVNELVPLRVAVAYLQETGEVRLAGGIGIFYQRLSLDLAYQQIVDPVAEAPDPDDRLLVVSLGIRAF